MSQSRGEGSGGEGAFGGVSSSLPDDVGRLRARIQVQVSRIELQERRIAQLQREKDEAVAYASQQQVKLKGGEQGGRGYGAPSSSFSSRSQRRRGSSWGEGPGIGEEERLREEQDALVSTWTTSGVRSSIGDISLLELKKRRLGHVFTVVNSHHLQLCIVLAPPERIS